MKRQRSFYGVEEGINFHVTASKKPSKETEKAIRELVKAAFKQHTKKV
jgi:hypothetical protein